MAHLISENRKLIDRVRRIAGQVAAIERKLTEQAECVETLQLVASTRGAITGLMDELVEDHLRAHVAQPGLSDTERAEAAEELVAIIKRYGR